jgi:hypothetical protein
MKRGLGPPLIWMVVVIHMHLRWRSGPEGDRQTGYMFSWRCARIGFSNVSRKSNRLFATMICHMGLAVAWMDLPCAKPDCTEP